MNFLWYCVFSLLLQERFKNSGRVGDSPSLINSNQSVVNEDGDVIVQQFGVPIEEFHAAMRIKNDEIFVLRQELVVAQRLKQSVSFLGFFSSILIFPPHIRDSIRGSSTIWGGGGGSELIHFYLVIIVWWTIEIITQRWELTDFSSSSYSWIKRSIGWKESQSTLSPQAGASSFRTEESSTACSSCWTQSTCRQDCSRASSIDPTRWFLHFEDDPSCFRSFLLSLSPMYLLYITHLQGYVPGWFFWLS